MGIALYGNNNKGAMQWLRVSVLFKGSLQDLWPFDTENDFV